MKLVSNTIFAETKWRKRHNHLIPSKNKLKNIVKTFPGHKSTARNIKTEYEAFSKIIDDL